MQINVYHKKRIKQVGEEVRKYTDRPIKVRNKPRPGNECKRDIKEDLKTHVRCYKYVIVAIDVS